MDSSSESSKIENWLQSQNFFHGYLFREDLPTLLQNHGDFLLRCSEVAKQKPKEIIVSVLYDPEVKTKVIENDDKMESIRNIIIQSTSSQGKRYYFFDQKTMFSSIEELIKHYMEHPILINQAKIFLKNGVYLADWEHLAKAVEVGKFIGTGPFGEIRKGKLMRRDGKTIDVSVRMTKGRSDTCKLQMKELVRQARVMREIAHPNVLRFHGVCLLQIPILVLLELVSGAALDAYLMDNKTSISIEEKMRMMTSAAWGLEFLHSKGILFRDIAAKNCLYTTEKLLKINEFGSCRRGSVYKMRTPKKGSSKIDAFIKWMAPESIRTYTFSHKADVYSYGVLVYEIFACKEPYAKLSTNAAKEAVLSGNLNKFPKETPKRLASYLEEKIWNMNPDKRASMPEVVQWMANSTGFFPPEL